MTRSMPEENFRSALYGEQNNAYSQEKSNVKKLAPLSKSELQSIFEKYKEKLGQNNTKREEETEKENQDKAEETQKKKKLTQSEHSKNEIENEEN